MRNFVIAVCSLIVASFGSAGFAGVTVDYVTQAPDSGVLERVRFQIQGNNLRFSTQGGVVGTATSDYYLYNHSTRTLRYVQPQIGTYHELRSGMMREALTQLETQRARLQELLDTTLADAPPERRATIEQALSALDQAGESARAFDIGNLAGQSRVIGQTGSLTLDGMPCEVYRVSLYNNEMEACFADADTLGLEPGEVAVMQSFQQSLSEITGMATLYTLVPGRLPLAASFGQLGAQGSMTTLLSGVERSDLPSSRFALPSHYSQAPQIQ